MVVVVAERVEAFLLTLVLVVSTTIFVRQEGLLLDPLQHVGAVLKSARVATDGRLWPDELISCLFDEAVIAAVWIVPDLSCSLLERGLALR